TRRRVETGAPFAFLPGPTGPAEETVSEMERIVRLIRPWATPDGSGTLESMVMEARDRTANLAFFGAAAVVWVLVGLVVTTRDPLVDRSAGIVGAALMGLAVALTLIPILWLTVFGRHRQIAYQGDWLRAIRRAAWVGIVVAVLVVLRLQGLLELPIALCMIALVLVAEATLSDERRGSTPRYRSQFGGPFAVTRRP